MRSTDTTAIKELQETINLEIHQTFSVNAESYGYEIDEEGFVTALRLSNCKIKKIGDILPAIIKLKKLRHLSLSYNSIRSLKGFELLPHLTDIDMSDNKISNVNPLRNCSELQRLDLSNNVIADLSQIKDFKSLRKLYLHGFQNASIDGIQELVNLEGFYSCQGNIDDLSPLKNLKNLEHLYLNNNQISKLDPITGLSKLKILSVVGNKIKDISALENLRNLKKIFLARNLFDALPIWITDLGIKITWSDSHEFENEDSCIMLFDNPIKTPPVDIIKLGNEAIIRYFEKIKDEGIDYLYEAKLTLVGEGSAGKTSLQVRLIKPTAALPKKDNRTRGIKIYDWKFKTTKGQPHIAHIWDFGGQDVYYPVHRFFLTENSVFVLLASTRQTHHNFDYWIPTIYQFGGKSPIILGQTCHQGNKAPWNDLGYYVANPHFNIIKVQDIPYQEINLLNKNEGLKKIKQVIITQIENLPHYGKGVPSSWVPLRKLIGARAESVACLPFEAFKELCKESNPKAFSNFIDILDFASFLHSIGVILWYSEIDTLKDWVVLQPEWAMNAVYRIIDDEEIQKRRGLILAKDFNRLWVGKEYDEKHSILKKMLEVFKIAFPKKHKKEEYIIPARLLSMPAEFKWMEGQQYLQLEHKYEFMPKGLVNQLSSELSRYIGADNEVWNNAVNFKNVGNTAEAQVEEDFYNRKLSIKAKGKDSRGLIILILDALQNIVDGYKGVRPEIYVPCTCIACQKALKPTTFLYTDLLRWSGKSDKATVACNESGSDLLIDKLLYNVGLPNLTGNILQKEKNKTVKIFIASSSELKDDREKFEIFINRENKRLNKEGVFLELNMWEDFLDSMSRTRLQDEYNKAATNSDVFISLFFTKVGKYTAEEFEKAFGRFTETGKPHVYTYFKDDNKSIAQIKKEDINSKFDFEEKLKLLGHFPTVYKSIDDLKYQFKMQLEILLPQLI